MASNVPRSFPTELFHVEILEGNDYCGNPTTLTDLKDAIESEIRSIGPAITSAVMNSMNRFCVKLLKFEMGPIFF